MFIFLLGLIESGRTGLAEARQYGIVADIYLSIQSMLKSLREMNSSDYYWAETFNVIFHGACFESNKYEIAYFGRSRMLYIA